jgi:plasmid maintenance system antidote protein VapI
MQDVRPLAELQRRLDGKTQTALAEELGISVGHLNDILMGRRAIGPQVLKALGLERVVSYRKTRGEQASA